MVQRVDGLGLVARHAEVEWPQDQITIGVPAYRDPKEVRLTDVLALPFRKQRPSWTFPDDGKLVPEISDVPENQLLP